MQTLSHDDGIDDGLNVLGTVFISFFKVFFFSKSVSRAIPLAWPCAACCDFPKNGLDHLFYIDFRLRFISPSASAMSSRPCLTPDVRARRYRQLGVSSSSESEGEENGGGAGAASDSDGDGHGNANSNGAGSSSRRKKSRKKEKRSKKESGSSSRSKKSKKHKSSKRSKKSKKRCVCVCVCHVLHVHQRVGQYVVCPLCLWFVTRARRVSL